MSERDRKAEYWQQLREWAGHEAHRLVSGWIARHPECTADLTEAAFTDLEQTTAKALVRMRKGTRK